MVALAAVLVALRARAPSSREREPAVPAGEIAQICHGAKIPTDGQNPAGPGGVTDLGTLPRTREGRCTTVNEPDPLVVAAARRGDLRAFETLVRAHQGDVWRLSWQLVHDDSLAADVTQEAFLRAWRFLPRYRGESKFSTWLFSITRNCARDELRRSGRRERLQDRLELTQPAVRPNDSARLEVCEALGRLPLELREPVVLIDLFGASYREVATVLGAPEGTIKSRVHRARSLLAAELGPRAEEGDRGRVLNARPARGGSGP